MHAPTHEFAILPNAPFQSQCFWPSNAIPSPAAETCVGYFHRKLVALTATVIQLYSILAEGATQSDRAALYDGLRIWYGNQLESEVTLALPCEPESNRDRDGPNLGKWSRCLSATSGTTQAPGHSESAASGASAT